MTKTTATTVAVAGLSGALTAGSRAYVNGVLELVRSLREVAELAHARTMEVIAPFAALLKQNGAI